MAKVFSTEDGKLSGSVRVIKERQYSDLDLSFAARTVTDGDVYKKTDAAAVKQSIKTLLLTNRNEKPYRPKFGANLSGLLFSLTDEDTGAEIASRIKNTITQYEPRAEIISLRVSATPDYNSVSVKIEFRVVNTNIVDVLDLKLTEPAAAPVPVKPDPSVIPIVPITPPELQVDFDGMILTSGGKALITSKGEVILRVAEFFAPDVSDDNGILTQNGLFLLSQDDKVLLVQQDLTFDGFDDDAIITQNGGFFLLTQDGEQLLLIQSARDGFITTENDILYTEDGGGVPPYGGRILQLTETAPAADPAGGFLTTESDLVTTQDDRVILEPEY